MRLGFYGTCFVFGLLALPLSGAGLTFFAAAKKATVLKVKRESIKGSCFWRIPGGVIAHHGVEPGEHLAHAGDKGDLGLFAFGAQSIAESLDVRFPSDDALCMMNPLPLTTRTARVSRCPFRIFPRRDAVRSDSE